MVQLTGSEIGGEFLGRLQNALRSSAGIAVTFDDAVFVGDVNFSGVAFGNVSFNRTSFERDTRITPHAEFVGTRFAGNASFVDAVFHQANFSKATFEHDASFVKAQFGPATSFANATFDTAAHFDHAHFAAPDAPAVGSGFRREPPDDLPAAVDFTAAVFTGEAWFRSAAFAAGGRFTQVSFSRRADFDQINVGRRLDFDQVTVGPELTIETTDSAPTVVTLDKLRLVGPTVIAAGDQVRLTIDGLVLVQPLTVKGHARLTSLQDATLMAPLTIGGDVALTDCSMLGSTGLEQLRLTGDPAWAKSRRRRRLADERPRLWCQAGCTTPNPAKVEAVYRQLRAGLESSKAAPAAADFYYGEMEMRRFAAPCGVERGLLATYKWFGGYGVRALRPFATYLALLAITAAGFRCRTTYLVTDPKAAGDGLNLHHFGEAAAYAARNSISLLSAPTTGLTAAGTFVLIADRFLAVTLLALTVLALRARVQR